MPKRTLSAQPFNAVASQIKRIDNIKTEPKKISQSLQSTTNRPKRTAQKPFSSSAPVGSDFPSFHQFSSPPDASPPLDQHTVAAQTSSLNASAPSTVAPTNQFKFRTDDRGSAHNWFNAVGRELRRQCGVTIPENDWDIKVINPEVENQKSLFHSNVQQQQKFC